MNKGITIIIPCYNVEKYIEKCLDSILKQGLERYEIILINDCSTDDTLNIIKKYQKKNNKIDIKLINNKTNVGAGASRNKAIKQATYEYISFIDSDDYISQNYYKDMLSTIEKEKATLVVCDMMLVYEDQPLDDLRVCAYSGKKDKYGFINTGMAASPCNKIFLKDELMEFCFPENIMNEDIATVIPALTFTKKIAYCDSALYNYVQHSNSVQNSELSFKRFDIFNSLDILRTRIYHAKDFEKIWDIIVYQQIIMLVLYIPEKDNRIFFRAKFLKAFYNCTKDWRLRQNPYYFNVFIPSQTKFDQIYYKIIMKLNCNGFSLLTSLCMTLHKILKIFNKKKSVIKSDITIDDLVIEAKKQEKKESDISISVIVPNYNYSKFLYERIYSILYQTEKVNEIIILDDCSTDNSTTIITNIVDTLKPYINIKYEFNKKNSGSVFKQWQKGMSLANGDYFWIAEADDYCSKYMLKNHLKQIRKDDNITLSYVDTGYINKDGNIILKTIKPEIDIQKTNHWEKSFINDGKDEIEKYSYLNCTIANVSSVLFKKDNYDDCFLALSEYKQVGDWFFYLQVMEQGKVAFCNKVLNYYRVHGNNVTSLTKKQLHFDEIKKLHKYLDKKMKFTKEQKKKINERYAFLREVWKVK